MILSTLRPGNWPPSPGFAPCAILICSSSALTRQWIVTPQRPEATCFIAARRPARTGAGAGAVGVGGEAARPPAAPAGFRASAEAVHRDRERLVRLAGDRAEAHRA